MEIVLWALRGLGVYLVIGALFAAWFVVGGIGRISPASRGAGWGFRVLIAPGSAALWPVLLFELIASGGRGGLVVGRALDADDVETSLDGVPADHNDANGPARYVDPEAETDPGPDRAPDAGGRP